MSGTIEPPELVEDPGQQEQSSATEDRATEKRGHGTQEVGPAHSDADSAEDNLERCFAEEMAAMESGSDDNGSDDSDELMGGGVEERSPCTNDLENLDTACHGKGLSEDASAARDWSQFMSSTKGMLQYMEEAIATIDGVSSLHIVAPGQEQITQDHISEGVDHQEQSSSSPRVLFSPRSNIPQFEPNSLPPGVLPRLPRANMKNLGDTTEPSTAASLAYQLGLTTAELLETNDSMRNGISSVPDRPPGFRECQASVAKEADISESDLLVGVVGSSAQEMPAMESSPPPPSSGNPGRDAGFDSNPDKQISEILPNNVSATGLLTPTMSNQSLTGDAPVQRTPFSVVHEEERSIPKAEGSEPELSLAELVLETSRMSTSKQEEALFDQVSSDLACFEGRLPAMADVFSQMDVMASVGEAEVSRRIGREKARCKEARQKRRRDSITRARREGSLVAFQAAWRGRRARAKTAPALAARRQESEEKRRMFEEERLAECFVALEAERLEVEAKLQMKEQKAMRCEETRTRESWLCLRRLEETARGEELVRMRAEERFTRAVLDLELQDLRRLERARRETAETMRMRSEDQAMQYLKRLEEAQVAEREAMGVEDVLAGEWKKAEGCELAFARAEESRMAVEDHSSSAWNAEYRRLQESRLRQAWARSTPIQRAMDPGGKSAARALVCSSPTVSNRRDSQKTETRAGTKLKSSSPFDGERTLTLERARRRECCKSHVEKISSYALQVRSSQQTAAKGLHKMLKGSGGNRDARSGSQRGAPLREWQVSPREERGRQVERDGEECELTVDMLSHLGPLQDLTALELCVEGLTSAPLLKACTSLKSLSLNVNRLSSPAGLVVSTSLVRLGLRDNRLSSLGGLSGLPSLRELRLDINHLTSLHELKQLPALVELSANTNHIRELPEEFAIGLMSPKGPVPDRTKPRSSLVEKAVACGGLQKLELYHNRIEFVHPRALQGLASLTHLDLGRNQLRKLDGQALESCPALSTLVLSQNLLQEPPSPLCLPLLSELWLSGNQISSMGVWPSCPPQEEAHPPLKRLQRCAFLEEASNGVEEVPSEGGLGTSPGHQGKGCSEISESDPEGRGRVTRPGHDEEREGRDKVLKGGQGGQGENDTSEVGVWLPSLEVLHLQDNALESLGGRAAFVGCPLLRSFDASFNQLRTPTEIGNTLEACSELEEVRLHDNPASSSPDYTDAVALSCPKLTRMDGVQLDTQMHWRAGANTYGARADLVLPFLLSTDESSDFQSSNEQTGERVSEAKVPSKVEPDEACPWCGAGTPSNENKHASANDSIGGASTVGIGDEEGELNPAYHGGELPQPSRCTVGNDASSRERTCASCGFSFPDTDLWAVPDSRAGPFPFNWEDVCSAGDRWRGEFCLGTDLHDALETNQKEEESNASAFRTACLRGRDERASMRRRQRREERELAGRAHLDEADLRTPNTRGDSTSRLASMAPSRRRLEVELELGKRHAEERRDQAARQLSFHGGVVDVGNMDRRNGAAPESKQASGLRHTEGSRVHQNPAHRRSRAARVIQRLWYRSQERAARSRPGLLEDATTRPVEEQAVMKLQSAFRGFHVRRALQAALDSARYVDDEVEGLLNVNGGARFELDRFLSPPPELADGWWGDSSSTLAVPRHKRGTLRHPTPPNGPKATGARLMDTARVVVSNSSRRSIAIHGHAEETTRETDLGSPGFGHGNDKTVRINESPRSPMDTDQSAREAGESFRHEDTSLEATDNVREEGRNKIGSARAGENGLARAWGLKDPRVARAMLKRAKRMQKFQNGEARREKMKNPDVRFDAFAKNAGERRAVRGVVLTEAGYARADSSRSHHGGRVNAHRYRGTEGARGHGSRKQAASPRLAPIADAWAKGETSDGAVTTIDPAKQQITRNEGRPWPPLKTPHRGATGGNLLSHKTRSSDRPGAVLLCAHKLDEEVFLEKGPRSAGSERRAGVG